MKNSYVLFALAMATLAACSKKDDVAPDAGTIVAGTYTLNYFRVDSAGTFQDSLNLPVTFQGITISGSIIATRISPTVDSLTVILRQTGETDENAPLGRVDLQTNGTAHDLYVGSRKVGTSDGTNITIDTDPGQQGGYRYIFRGKK